MSTKTREDGIFKLSRAEEELLKEDASDVDSVEIEEKNQNRPFKTVVEVEANE